MLRGWPWFSFTPDSRSRKYSIFLRLLCGLTRFLGTFSNLSLQTGLTFFVRHVERRSWYPLFNSANSHKHSHILKTGRKFESQNSRKYDCGIQEFETRLKFRLKFRTFSLVTYTGFCTRSKQRT